MFSRMLLVNLTMLTQPATAAGFAFRAAKEDELLESCSSSQLHSHSLVVCLQGCVEVEKKLTFPVATEAMSKPSLPSAPFSFPLFSPSLQKAQDISTQQVRATIKPRKHAIESFFFFCSVSAVGGNRRKKKTLLPREKMVHV